MSNLSNNGHTRNRDKASPVAPVKPLVAEIPQELRDEYPAQYGWRGQFSRITGIKLSPSIDERQHRKERRSEIRRGIAHEREDAYLASRIRRRKTRTVYQGQEMCGFLSVISEKGGVGKTTIASLVAMTMGRERASESIAVVDLNPDRGSLADRMSVQVTYSLRDLVNSYEHVMNGAYNPKQFMKQSPGTNVWVLPGDASPERRDSTVAHDVIKMYHMFNRHFSIAILDNGTGISHSAMEGNLNVSHGMVLVVENTNDAYTFIDSTLERLESLGFKGLRSRVILVVNEKVFLPPELMEDKVNAKFNVVTGADIAEAYRARVKNVIVVPFDPTLARSGPIIYDSLLPETVKQVKRLSAALLDDLVLQG